MNNDISVDIGNAPSGNESNSSSSGGRKGSSQRSPISVKEDYGTSFYGTETECKKCSTRAVGVLIMPDEIVPEESVCRSVPLCREHRDQTMDQFGTAWTASEFRRFVDA